MPSPLPPSTHFSLEPHSQLLPLLAVLHFFFSPRPPALSAFSPHLSLPLIHRPLSLSAYPPIHFLYVVPLLVKFYPLPTLQVLANVSAALSQYAPIQPQDSAQPFP